MIGFAIWVGATYPRIGGEELALASKIETTLYRLHRAEIEISDSRLMSWQGGSEDSAETVVMIHGYSSEKTVWMRFASHFTNRYRVLILYLPGHGQTAFDPALKYDSVSQGERVLQAMDTLGIASAHIIGNSMGGFIAAQIALHHPGRVRSAILIDAAGVVAPNTSDMERMRAQGRNPFEMSTRAEFDTFYAMTMAQPPWLPRMILDYMADDYIARRESLARIFHDFHDVDMLDARLSEFSVPVLLLWGERDRLLDISSAEVWKNGIPGAQLITYPELGHMPMLENASRSLRDVLDFIAKHQ
ncbi:MAG: abhydrolase domain-containing protein 6 [Zhongshania sp.]